MHNFDGTQQPKWNADLVITDMKSQITVQIHVHVVYKWFVLILTNENWFIIIQKNNRNNKEIIAAYAIFCYSSK